MSRHHHLRALGLSTTRFKAAHKSWKSCVKTQQFGRFFHDCNNIHKQQTIIVDTCLYKNSNLFLCFSSVVKKDKKLVTKYKKLWNIRNSLLINYYFFKKLIFPPRKRVFKNTTCILLLMSFSNMHRTTIEVAGHVQCHFNTTRNAGKQYKLVTKQ